MVDLDTVLVWLLLVSGLTLIATVFLRSIGVV